MSDLVGQVLNNRYLVETEIGKGGMGSVYQGTHIAIGRRVAIKFLHTEFVDNEDLVLRFFREAQAAAAIEHKSIIDVLDVGVSADNDPYMVMAYLEGESLAELLIRKGSIDFAAACAILEPVLLGLNAAHKKGIIHRDLKPDNIFMVHEPDSDEVSIKIIDFGISKILGAEDEQGLTQAGAMLGTPFYMSPEQAMGSLDIDHRTDVYALGVILFEMLTGERPFIGTNVGELAVKIATEDAPAGRDVKPDFPIEAQPILDRSLCRDADKRFADAIEMLDALRQCREFQRRHEQLTEAASGIVNTHCAFGDLGEEGLSSGEKSPRQILSHISKSPSPVSWTQPPSRPPAKKQTVYWLVGGIGTMILVGIVAFGLGRAGTGEDKMTVLGTSSLSVNDEPRAEVAAQKKSPVSDDAPTTVEADDLKKNSGNERLSAGAISAVESMSKAEEPKHPDNIEVSVKGIPKSGIIWVGDEKMETNPFFIPYNKDKISIKIIADGFEPKLIDVIPTKDTVLSVDLSPLPTKKTEAKPAPTLQKIKASNNDPHDKRRFRKGKRGAEIGEDFI